MTTPRPQGGTRAATVLQDDAAHVNTAGIAAEEHREAQEKYPLSFLNLTCVTKTAVDWIIVVAVWVLSTAVSTTGSGFGMAGGDRATELFQFAQNPSPPC